MDCFATLAMTVRDHHSAADRCRILSDISLGTGDTQGAPRRRLTSTSIQYISQPWVGPKPSMVPGPWMLRACAPARHQPGLSPERNLPIFSRALQRNAGHTPGTSAVTRAANTSLPLL